MKLYRCMENDNVVEYNKEYNEFYFFTEGSTDKLVMATYDLVTMLTHFGMSSFSKMLERKLSQQEDE